MSFRNYKKDIHKIELKQKERAAWRQTEYSLVDAIAAMEKKRNEYVFQAKNELELGNNLRYNIVLNLLREILSNIVQASDMLKNLRIALELNEEQNLTKKLVVAINSVLNDICKIDKAFRVAISQELFANAVSLQHSNFERLKELFKNNNIPFSNRTDTVSNIINDEIRMFVGEKAPIKGQDINNIIVEADENYSPAIALPNEVAQSEVGDRSIAVQLQPKESSQSLDIDNPHDLKQRNRFTYYGTPYTYPSLDLLNDIENREEIRERNERDIVNIIQVLEDKFRDFGIEVETVKYTVGAAFSRLELKLVSNTPLAQIARIEKDINMAVKRTVRLLLPIPGTNLIGVEIPNAERETIPLKAMIPQVKETGEVNIRIGFDIEYTSHFKPLNSLPHLLIGGTTGSGKSNFLHALITQLLFSYSPTEVRFVLVDFKRVELGMYNGIPHLVGGKTIDEYDDAIQMFQDLIDEMERRYQLFLSDGVRNISEYNSDKKAADRLPRIIMVIDEYADLVGSEHEKQIERFMQRLAQKARASGIHLVVSTQRPSVKVINGVIKANFPTRIAFTVASHVDSLNILDFSGAENLTSLGDMVFSYFGEVERLQAPYVAIEEISRVNDYIRKNN